MTERQLKIVLIALIAVCAGVTVLNFAYSVEPIRAAWRSATAQDYSVEPIRAAWRYVTANDFPSGWATLLGLVLGLSAIAWQTSRGFKYLIASQKNQAELDRKAMLERADLDRQAHLHQAQIEVEATENNRKQEAKVLAAALLGELLIRSKQHASSRAGLLLMKFMLERLAAEGSKPTSPTVIARTATPVFDANVSKMGLLPPSLASDVTEVFAMLAVELNWPAQVDPRMLATALEETGNNIPNQVRDMAHVCQRLLVFQTGESDPGPLSEHRPVATEPRAKRFRAS